MTPDDLRSLADALSSGTHYVESPELHETMMRAADYLRACADAKPVAHYAMLDSHRRLVEQAIQSAEHPSGMSTHDGKARIDASILRRMLAIIDSLSAVPAGWKLVPVEPTHEVAICATGDSPQSMETANARYIAACHPEAIRELLAAHDALKAENEKLLTLERDVLSTLPGVYYMDPPDGGDVSLLKQLKRMANDAARYRQEFFGDE